MIGRRDFITLLGGAAAAWPVAARAQQPSMPVIGVLYGVSAAESAERMVAFRGGLGETGFVESHNVAIEYRWANGQLDRMPWMAVDLLARRVAVILIGGDTAAVREMVAAAKTIPIVFTTGADAVEAGLVASLNRPGNNVTGVTSLSSEVEPKRLELLHQVAPGAKKVAFLINENNRTSSEGDIHTAQTAAPRLGLEWMIVNGGSESEIGTAFGSAAQQGVGAVFVGSDSVLYSRGDQIAALALQYKLPTISSVRNNVRAGQLISYGIDVLELYRRAGMYVGRILKGEKAGDLPVVQPTKFELAINLKTAKALGLTISRDMLLLADEVIE